MYVAYVGRVVHVMHVVYVVHVVHVALADARGMTEDDNGQRFISATSKPSNAGKLKT